MKALKIILAVIVVGIIGFFVWKWSGQGGPGELSDIKPPTNPYTTRIEREIDSLSKIPSNAFCKEFYQGIQYRITDYYKQGFLGKSTKDNTQWEEILSKNLYSAYAPKFAEQALYVFNGSEWKIENLTFIRSELNTLQHSTYLEGGSSVDDSFGNIRAILMKYDEIVGFISSCKGFSYSNFDIGTSFPVSDVSSKIQKSKAYLSNGLDNIYVNNCTRLKKDLLDIPQTLFFKHISYLQSKIQQNSGRYETYNYQSDYSNIIFTPLKNQIDALDNNIYGVSESTFNSNYSSLDNMLTADNRNATDYFRSHKK